MPGKFKGLRTQIKALQLLEFLESIKKGENMRKRLPILIIFILFLIFLITLTGCKETEQEQEIELQEVKLYKIVTHGEPDLFGNPCILSQTYYATEIIDFESTSIRFIEQNFSHEEGEEMFITAERIEVERIE